MEIIFSSQASKANFPCSFFIEPRGHKLRERNSFAITRLGRKNLKAGDAFKGFVKRERNGCSCFFIGTA